MLKKHMAACLFATALMAAPALAQTSPAPSTSAPSGMSGQSAQAGSGQFMTQPQANQWRASKLVGVNIYGTDNQKIGDVNEVLIDRQGNADAVVIGVGGFLGIGEKDVAVPFSAIDWKYDRSDLSTAARTDGARTTTATTATTANPPAAGTSAPAATATNPPATGTVATAPSTAPAGTTSTTATTGTAGTTATTGTARTTAGDMNRGYPDHGVLRMTKADLQNAPTFSYDGNAASRSNPTPAPATGTGMGTGSGTTAPRQ